MINNNARQALSDLLTYHKIKTVDGYERKLLAAINSADSLNIKDVQTFTKYALVFNTFEGITFEQLSYFERIKDADYYKFLIKNYEELGFDASEKKKQPFLYMINGTQK